MMQDSELVALKRKPNKSADEWAKLVREGWADEKEDSSFILNEVGLAEGRDIVEERKRLGFLW